VRCNPAIDEPVYFPPYTADPDLALVLLPDGWLTRGALIEAARVYLRRSEEWGPTWGRGEEVNVRRWVPQTNQRRELSHGTQSEGPALSEVEGLPVFLHPDGEIVCKEAQNATVL